jgi:hypothetical protein
VAIQARRVGHSYWGVNFQIALAILVRKLILLIQPPVRCTSSKHLPSLDEKQTDFGQFRSVSIGCLVFLNTPTFKTISTSCNDLK